MTTQYFVPGSAIVEGRVAFPLEETKHLSKVLRAEAGDVVVVTDGEGWKYRVRLDIVDKKGAFGTVVDKQEGESEPSYRLTMGVALLKNAKRYETFLEKAVETGVSGIIPLITSRTEKRRLRLDRAQNILIAALKQSGRSRLPVLHAPLLLSKLVENDSPERIFACHESKMDQENLLKVCGELNESDSLTILVGPEGGFSEQEISTFLEKNIQLVSLGPRRLRTETAAIAAASIVMAALE